MSVDLEELERLASKAFCAPWTYEKWTIDCPHINEGNECGYEHNLTTVLAPHEYPGSADEPCDQVIAQIDVPGLERFADANGALIVAMRNALPAMIAEMRQLRSDAETRAKFDAIAEKIKDICERQLAAANEATMREIAERDALKAENESLKAENERLRASIRHRTDAVIASGIYANAYRDGLGVAETEITEWLQSEGHHELAKRIVAQEHRREDDDTRRIDRVAELEAENERLRDELQRANNFGAHMVEKYGEKGDW